jgi:salicylate hydroxylase
MSSIIYKPSTVLVVGAGIAGPTLALLLQQKGYLPVLVEKVLDLGDVGVALALAPNG